ncbi:MAG: AsmA family protein [Fibromonadales bacterium]|nr:AsmA family protein [Fibromonadales bacterium]
MKKLFKIAGILAIIFVLALIAAVIAIKQAFPPERIKALVEEQATKTLHREVSVGGAGFSIWPLGISLENIKVANNPGKGFSKDPMLDLPKAIVKIDLTKLLLLQVAIDKISIENLSLLYEVMPDGRTSIDGLGGAPDTTAKDTAKLDLSNIELPGSLALNSFEIKDAKVIFNDLSAKRKIILGDIDLSTSLSLNKTLENIKTSTALTLNEISLEDGGLGVRKGDISVFLNTDINANLRVQHVNIQKFSAGLQSINVNVSGTVDRFLEKTIIADVKVETNQIDLAALVKEIPAGINPEIPKVSASGTASFNAAVKGAIIPEQIPPVSGNLVLSNIAIGHSDLPAGVQSLTGNIAFTENTVSIKPLTFQLAGQPTNVLLEASNLLSKQPMLNNLSANTKLDLGALYALASKLITIKEISTLSGHLEANLSAKGILDPARPENISVSGSANMQNIAVKTPLIPDAISVNGAVKFSNTEISAEPAVHIGNSDVKVKAVVKDYLAMVMPKLAAGKKTNVNVDVSSSNLELDRLLPPGDPNKPAPEESPEMEIYPELPDVVANVNVNLAKTVFRHLTLSNFNLGVNFANNKATVAGKGQLYTGGFNTNVAVDLSNRKSANVKFALNVDKVEANDFISNGNNNITGDSEIAKQIRDLDNTVFGKFSMKMDVSTKGLPQNFIDNLTGPISVQIASGSLKGSKILGSVGSAISGFEVAGQKVLKDKVPINDKGDMSFDDLKAEFEAKDGQLLVKDLKVNANALGQFAFGGGVGFNGILNLKMQNTMSPSISSSLNSLTAKSPVALYQKDSKGNALLFFNIGGTFADPKVTLDASKMANPIADLKNLATAKINEVKDQAKAKLNEEKAKLEAAAKAQADKLKAEAEAQKKKLEAEAAAKKKEAEDKAKKEAENKVKGALKGLKK